MWRELGLVQLGTIFVALCVLAVVGSKLAERRPLDARAQFLAAAAELGITDRQHNELRADFERSTIAMERDPCNENLRKLAGLAAVEYYETLLEKPFVKAKLTMTQRNVCEAKIDGRPVANDPLSLVDAFNRGLRLPWDCLPQEWRTPSDLALQATLETNIRTLRLTSDSLTGTLGLLAKPWENSHFAQRCEPREPRRSYSDNSRPNLPVIAAPPDSWNGPGRRYR
jgi:hypothetical protein